MCICLHSCILLLGQMSMAKKPPLKPEFFLPSILATHLNERDLAISADGNEIYFTVVAPQNAFSTIFYCKKQGSLWSKPQAASFSGQYSDLEPSLSPDGKKLFFASKRPVDGKEKNDYDIWYVQRKGGGWSDPVPLGPEVNTDQDEFYPSISQSGNLYFTAAYHMENSKEDIFMAAATPTGYKPAVALDTAINSKTYEFNAYVAPDESYLLFTAYGRTGDLGRGDIYISFREDGQWQTAMPITSINSDRLDYCPTVSPDQKMLFFTSERHQLSILAGKVSKQYEDYKLLASQPANGTGNIYWVDFDQVCKEVKSRRPAKPTK
jgi:Tol biopolymer transport system component